MRRIGGFSVMSAERRGLGVGLIRVGSRLGERVVGVYVRAFRRYWTWARPGWWRS